MSDKQLTWEEAVQWLKSQSDRQDLVRACYYDDSMLEAAQRFVSSEEWQAVFDIAKAWMKGDVLDLGAGNGISSYAFAIAGCKVTALEPNPSDIVGAGAITKLAKESNLDIKVIQSFGESLPFDDNSFDIVYGRQVLHHADNLPKLCQEAARVLRPKGLFIATREHVISQTQDLEIFLQSHPLHQLYGGENAFLLKQYYHAISQAGLTLHASYGHYQSVINYAPITKSQHQTNIANKLKKYVGSQLANWLSSQPNFMKLVSNVHTWRDRTAGRLYSFVATKS
ncbi:SAM-dependent methyltransferase [Pseudanabaena sp. lw0831]|uniref:class I SAM-dependent methyltransferase n=1 Tax=Pseudanabaena sp. lw0831 TaxID=1357935 RepID=UPI001915A0F0|nr:class I SAM-dependent methyltransferase [Pseudanabaena sp. lw0831]GBO51697.1 SAM-dependent methyltransferase [Pseudanabaena sp. lw0831]